jgi:hypothetical protein
MPRTASPKKKFIVSIESCRNATWQGRIFDAEGNSELPFRSVLEMLKLMDESVDHDMEH